MLSRHPLRDGVVAGLIGAISVAAWFFVLDALAGRPFFTPAVLGAAVVQLLGGGFGGLGLATHVVIYTLVHVAAFVALSGVLGAVSGALLGEESIPPQLLSGLANASEIRAAADELAARRRERGKEAG